MWRWRVLTGLVVSALVLAGIVLVTGAGHPAMRHSGTIVGLEGDGQAFVLAEIAPWPSGDATRTRSRVELTNATAFVVARRTIDATTGSPGEFVETAASRAELVPSRFVTVECEHDGPRMIARTVTVVHMEEP